MRFVFVGDPRHDGDGPAVFRGWGLAFRRDVPTEVTDERLAAKLAANDHFRAIEEAKRRGNAR